MNLIEEIKEEFPELEEKDFNSHEGDLYVKYSIPVYQWIMNYYAEKYPEISPTHFVTKFLSQKENDYWIEIAFGYINENYQRNVIR